MQVLWSTSKADEPAQVAENLATAQTILDAAEISLPTGNLANGAYDALGNYYHFPEWIVSDPKNILAQEEDQDEEEDTATSGNDLERDTNEDDNDKPGKGKALRGPAEEIKIMARLSESGKDITVTVNRTDYVRSIVSKIGETCAVSCPHLSWPCRFNFNHFYYSWAPKRKYV